MDKIVPISESEFVKPSWIQSLGDFNSLPLPFRPIDENEYIQLFFSGGGFNHIEYRQVKLAEWKCVRDTYIFWAGTYGIAVVRPASWGVNKETGKVFYKEPILYFRIGCEHEYEEITASHISCEHTVRCRLCGKTHSYSSDG